MEIAGQILLRSWSVIREMAPYLLFGFFVAGMLSVLFRPEAVERHLGGKSLLSVFKAAFFGIPLPLCSCGVIPLTASLRRHGASRGAAAAFTLSTPQTGVDSIFVTLSLLGPLYAVFRPLAALATGILGGSLVNALDSGREQAANDPEESTPCCTACEEAHGGWGKFKSALRYGFSTLPRDIGKPLLVGVLAAGIISAVFRDDFFAGLLGGGVIAMIVMMIVGLPVYVCATASVPIAATLIAKGVSPGATLVFLMTGPATNAAAVATLWKVLGKRATLATLATAGLAALLLGLCLDHLVDTFHISVKGFRTGHMEHGLFPLWLQTAAAGVLLALVCAALFRPFQRHDPKEEKNKAEKGKVETILLTVAGMTCSHCARSVQRELLESEGVQTAQVSLENKSAVVTGKKIDRCALIEAVEKLGYRGTIAEE